MNIVTVGSFCAGGIATDLLNCERNPFETSVIQSKWNHILKIADYQSRLHITLPEHTKEWLKRTEYLVQKDWTKGKYFGAHQPPQLIPNLNIFEHVINVTTNSDKSRFYRFLRHYYIEINGQKMIQERAIDEIKNMMNSCKFDTEWVDYDAPNVTNVEFEDIVEGKFCDSINGDQEHMAKWQKRNYFIFQEQDPELIKLWEACT